MYKILLCNRILSKLYLHKLYNFVISMDYNRVEKRDCSQIYQKVKP